MTTTTHIEVLQRQYFGKDAAFTAAVMELFQRNMGSFPCGLLEMDPYRWEHETKNWFEIREVSWGSGDEEEGGYALFDRDEGRFADVNLFSELVCLYIEEVEFDGRPTVVFYDEDDAEHAVSVLSREREEERLYGFPWANNTCFLPSEEVTTEDLHATGFVVATYRGGDGDEYRLAGIDGGGYSFSDAHFAPLALRLMGKRGFAIPLSNGEFVYPRNEWTILERLAMAVKED